MAKTRLTYQEVKEYIESFGYELLSKEYKNNKEYILIKCPNLNHEAYEVRFDNFKSGKRCKKCKYENHAKELALTYEDVKKYIESFEYQLLSEEYTNSHKKLKMICSEGHVCYINMNNFKSGRRCKKCFDEKLAKDKSFDYEMVKEMIELEGYKLLSSEYINANQKISIECPYGHKYEVTFGRFKCNGNRCPVCDVSKGEKKIMDWLNENNIKYIYDKSYFDDLLSPLGNLLRPDFIIEDRKIWIEYDGEFHYKKIYNEDGFEKIQIHDGLKDEYAKKNGWKLIRIPYWDFDRIEEILDKNLGEN